MVFQSSSILNILNSELPPNLMVQNEALDLGDNFCGEKSNGINNITL
jgi:hypothetical protein